MKILYYIIATIISIILSILMYVSIIEIVIQGFITWTDIGCIGIILLGVIVVVLFYYWIYEVEE